ncbi:MAG: fructosamine kinase family protein [Catalinimonas sp.]
MNAWIAEALRSHLGAGGRLLGQRPLSGGCINRATRLETTRGPLFLKHHPAPPHADLFVREAESLAALRATGALVVPEVIAAQRSAAERPAYLLTEFLEPGAPDDAQLGRGLAALHRTTADRYGFAHDNYCGATPQDNARHDNWTTFWGEQRIGHLLQLLRRTRGLSADEEATYGRLLQRLPTVLSHRPAPALTHGDLWSGNVMHTARGPALIDPACAWADRETDLALMHMFGGFAEATWAAYREAFPLEAGWRERRGLYELYHYLNHYLLFGGGYGPQALRIARGYL